MINDYEAKTPITSEDFSSTEKVGNDDVISTLNGLIETCKDGQNGFKEAAEGVERSDLKSLFYEFGQQRAQFAGELQSAVQGLGGEPEDSGSALAALHRGWINIKSVVTGKDEEAILNECERGEDAAKNAFKAALEMQLPSNIREIVQTQYTSVQAAHDRVKALRDSYKNETGGTSANTASTSY
ncbi:MAG TPA: PA2169 family four-helix-bundle protein [Pyrinomonadaceae bacterium]|nr:PA2169 family four-helix-bundle protein [Pyrinomonadaceae bacterium]